jgi:phage terminase large subunit-like protein
MYDEKLAESVVKWFPRYLKHTKGRWSGVPFSLLDWQADKIIRPLFGTLKDNGYRQYDTVYCEVPKKNGKSELAAGLALRLLFADHEPMAEIYGAASDRDQASIVFEVAAKMVEMEPRLAKRCKVLHSTKRIVHNNGSFYRVLSADAHTKHGFNSHGVIFDELHAQPNRELFDVLTEGAGDARTQPVFFYITTAGYNRESICWEVHEYARQVAEGVIDDPTFLPVIYGADENEDWRAKETWYKANPSLDVTIDIEKLEQACKQAENNPAKENLFRRLRLNQWTRQETRFIPLRKWDECRETIHWDDFEGEQCCVGLDLAWTTDIASYVLVFPVEDDYYVLPRFFIPSDNLQERSTREREMYEGWVSAGLITATPGNVIDYKWIVSQLEKDGEKYFIQELALDRWGATPLYEDLENIGFTAVRFGQGFKDMSPATKELLNLILAGRLKHDGNPVLRWMIDNMVVKQDPSGNIKPDKQKSTEKIDGVVAMIMGLSRAMANEASVYEDRGVVFV